MQQLNIIEQQGQRVLTSRQLCELYEVSEWQIKQNFSNNKTRYIKCKHYILLEGAELRAFKSKVDNFYLVGKTANKLYLWTEKGALLHAKSINTDKAWMVYDYLVDFYFRAKEIVPVNTRTEKLPEALPGTAAPVKKSTLHVKHPLPVFKALLQLAEDNGVCVDTYDFESDATSLINGNSVGIRNGLGFNQVVCELAYSLAHRFLHANDGNMIGSAISNARAERAAQMMIDALDLAV